MHSSSDQGIEGAFAVNLLFFRIIHQPRRTSVGNLSAPVIANKGLYATMSRKGHRLPNRNILPS